MVPIVGAFVDRRSWRIFRRRFDDLRLKPILDYAAYTAGTRSGNGGSCRFIGGFESVTDGHTLWIRSDDLMIPVSLAGAHTYVLPMADTAQAAAPLHVGTLPRFAAKYGGTPAEFDPNRETPEKIRWNRVASLTEGAKVFVGGALVSRDDRLVFVSTREEPLLVIFYDGPDRSLTARAIRAGRQSNEYWNHFTPYAFVLGAFSLIIMALLYLQRPLFRLTVITAFAAMFIPLFTLIPPGFLFTIFYRRLWWRARIFRAYRDLVRLPLRYLGENGTESPLPDGERYGGVHYETLPPTIVLGDGGIPLIIPEDATGTQKDWYIFGVLGDEIPREPRDVFATYGAIPGKPEKLARSFTIRAYTLEIVSWVLLLMGIGLNAFFIGLIITFLG
ncbi:hypothetical protein FACS189493_7190 [Spirochaetia bacterium]|nr:hypothetical protein FACS189493_7190 [Spirochaetia bacterium]